MLLEQPVAGQQVDVALAHLVCMLSNPESEEPPDYYERLHRILDSDGEAQLAPIV